MSETSASTSTERHQLPVRTLVAASIGNAVEWFDWTIYATFAVYFSSQFFDKSNPTLALIGTTSTYALAFFFRPLGGVLLGRLADLRGRKFAMLVTIMLMAGGSLLIAVLPTYSVVGWLAPILLLLARIAQGLSLGGEVSNASAYLAEIAPPNRRGRYSSFFYISTGTALLAASLLGLLLTTTLSRPELETYGWRIAFAVGGVLGIVGLYLRRTLVETEQFAENVEKAKATKNPLLKTLTHYPRSVLQLFGFTLLSTLCYYTFFSALTPFAVQFRDAAGSDVFLALSIGTVVFILGQYPFGALADKFGRKPQMLVWSGAFVRPHRAAEPAHHRTSTTDQPDHRVLGGPRALLGVLLDRAGDHERDLPDRAPGAGDRRLVQPHRRDLRRHGAAAHRGAVRCGASRPVLLVRLRWRADRVPDHPHAARDEGP